MLIHFLEKERGKTKLNGGIRINSEFTTYFMFCLSKRIFTKEAPGIIPAFNANV